MVAPGDNDLLEDTSEQGSQARFMAPPVVPPRHARYADFGTRLAAWLIDAVIVRFAQFMIFYVLARALPRETQLSCFTDSDKACEVPTSSSLAIMLALVLLFDVAYHALGDGLRGQTPGKRITGLYVIRANGDKLGVGRAVLRWLMRFVSAVPLLLGYLWSLWDSRRRTWHDIAVDSVVIAG